MFILFSVFFFAVTFVFFLSVVKGAPYLPASEESIKKIISLAEVKPGERVVDLGSGDGRVLIALARAGAEAHGYEINPLLVWWSRWNVRKADLRDRVFVHRKSMWKVDLSGFDTIVLFQITKVMGDLEKKLRSELKPNAKVASYHFVFPNWKPTKVDGNIYLYLQA